MGPLISAPHRAKVLGYIDSGVAQKATLRIDGRGLKVAGHEQGYFVGPTLFDHVTPAMTIYQEEIFWTGTFCGTYRGLSQCGGSDQPS